MKLSDDLTWRGLIKDKTFSDVTWLDTPKTFYLGIDAGSADSLTIGNLAIFIVARRLLDAGWKTILLVGGATSLIGDPKESEERDLKPREEVVKNVQGIKTQISKLFAGKPFTPADNYDWFKDIGYLDFLRDVGKNFAMSELMQREFITERLSSGISYAEFSYSLIQGYDYLQLYKQHNTVLQIGGSDQWGNMLSGMSLIRKKEGKEVQAFSMPLVVNKATGKKFCKSESGAVWLDPHKTSPSDFYQFWINVSDGDVEDYLKIFTLLPKEEIEECMAQQKADPASRIAQKKLAAEVTNLVHGKEAVAKAQTQAGALKAGAVKLDEQTGAIKLKSGISLVEALVKTGLAKSNTEARRLVEEGGVYLNNEPSRAEVLKRSDFEGGRVVIRKGKKFQNSALVELK